MIVVSFPDPAPRLNMNDSLHWRTRAKRVAAWRHAAKIHGKATRNGHPARLFPDPANVRLVLGVPDPGRKRDPSNWLPTCKAAIDGLTDAGYWDDDDSTHVTVLEPRFVKGSGVRIEITPREAS